MHDVKRTNDTSVVIDLRLLNACVNIDVEWPTIITYKLYVSASVIVIYALKLYRLVSVDEYLEYPFIHSSHVNLD